MAQLSKERAARLEAEKYIKENIQSRMENLVTGQLGMDFPTVKYNIGVIQGLKEALSLIEEAEHYVDEKWR